MGATTTNRVAATVRAEMARRGITGKQLAANLGWSQSSLSRRLCGQRPFDVDQLTAIAAHLDIPTAVLLGEEVAA